MLEVTVGVSACAREAAGSHEAGIGPVLRRAPHGCAFVLFRHGYEAKLPRPRCLTQWLSGLSAKDALTANRTGAYVGPITVRPIHQHKDERILGLLFANMMALLAFGITEMRVPS